MPLGWTATPLRMPSSKPHRARRTQTAPPKSESVPPPTTRLPRHSPGATLTGNARFDFVIGLMEEPLGIALLAFGLWQLLTVPYPLSQLLTSPAFGALLTGAFMLWHGACLRERYPVIEAGGKHGRKWGGKGWEHFLTLTYGAFLLAVLLPLGGLLLLTVRIFGIGAWLPVLIIVYGFGIIARRIRGENDAVKEGLPVA